MTDEVIKLIAIELAPEIDRLIDDMFDPIKSHMVAADELRRLLWDNKVGILRVLQYVAKLDGQ